MTDAAVSSPPQPPDHGASRRPASAALARRDRLHDVAAVAVPTALATVLCFIQIGARSLGFDEGASVTIAAQHGAALGSAIAHDGGNMSGYYALLHVVLGALGDGPLAIRFPSAVAIIATVAIVGVLGLRLFDRRVALVAGLLTAASLPLIFWAQYARGYAPMVALVSGSFLALVALLESDPSAPVSRPAWVAYVVCLTLAVYASFVAILVVPAQLLALLWFRRRRLRAVLMALGAVAVCCVPLVVLALHRGSGQLFWVPRPSLTSENQVLQSLTGSGLEPSFRSTSTTTPLLVLTIILLALIAGEVVRAQRRPAAGGSTWGALLALCWLVAPVLLAWLESLVGQPIFLPRNLLSAVPAVSLLLAWGITHPRVPRALSWALVAGVLALRMLQLIPSYGVSPEDWKAANAFVLAGARPRDCIAFYPADGRMAFQYYVGNRPLAISRAPRPVLPTAQWGAVRPFVEVYAMLSGRQLDRLAPTCPRLWLVSSHEGQPDGPAGSRANRARYFALRAGLERRYPVHQTVSFGYASPVRVELLAG